MDASSLPENGTTAGNLFCDTTIALSLTRSSESRSMKVGACVLHRLARSSMDDPRKWQLTLFDFSDNDQFSNLDAFLVQFNSGRITLLLNEDLNTQAQESNANLKQLARKLDALLLSRRNQGSVDTTFLKRSTFSKASKSKSGARETLLRLVHGCHGATSTHDLTMAETQAPAGYACADVLLAHLCLGDDEEYLDRCALHIGSLSKYVGSSV